MATNKSSKKFVLIVSLFGLIAMAAGLWLSLKGLKQTPDDLEIAGIYLAEPRDVSEFKLTGSDQQPFTRDSFRGHWNFLYFGYTYCPDACPLTLSQLNLVDKKLAEQDLNDNNAYILISVDPRRDSPERLAEYTRFFNENFSGATGVKEELDKLTKQMGIAYRVPEEPEDPENYLVDHSSAVILVNPDAKLQAVFTAPHEPERISEDFEAIRQRFEVMN